MELDVSAFEIYSTINRMTKASFNSRRALNIKRGNLLLKRKREKSKKKTLKPEVKQQIRKEIQSAKAVETQTVSDPANMTKRTQKRIENDKKMFKKLSEWVKSDEESGKKKEAFYDSAESDFEAHQKKTVELIKNADKRAKREARKKKKQKKLELAAANAEATSTTEGTSKEPSVKDDKKLKRKKPAKKVKSTGLERKLKLPNHKKYRCYKKINTATGEVMENSSGYTDSEDYDDNNDNSPESEESDLEDQTHPLTASEELLSWLIHPVDVNDFLDKNWEKTPLYIDRKTEDWYGKDHLQISSNTIDELLREHNIHFNKNIDVTTYINGKRETHNPFGRAYASVVWDYYMNDCSVRFLNPQTYLKNLHKLSAMLQEYFGCFVGSNLYLTPPNSQGFAPHYDDIEAFILQLEGKKRWRLYKPRTKNECLPRYPSKNFKEADLGKPIMDVVLKTGDVLYFPRGTIHQAETFDNTHSLHVTLSLYQRNSWGDFLEKLVPHALKNAIKNDVKFRAGLPVGWFRHTGTGYKGLESRMRDSMIDTSRELIQEMMKYIDVDHAADEIAKRHIHDYLPPVLTPSEAECTVIEDGERMMDGGKIMGMVEIEPDTKIRLTRQHVVRLVKDEEDGLYKLFYSTENAKEYHGHEINYLEIGEEFVEAVRRIIQAFPVYIKVESLPVEGLDKRIQLAKDLWERSIVLTRYPLPMEDV